MATIRELRGRWQAMVRRRGVPPRAKSFDRRATLNAGRGNSKPRLDRSGWIADTRLAERVTLGELLTRYSREISPTKRSAATEQHRLNGIIRRDLSHRTLAKLTSSDLVRYRDERLAHVSPAIMLHLYAALAEKERRMISVRTKDALAAAKARGVKLGGTNAKSLVHQVEAAERAQSLRNVMDELAGLSARAAAYELNRRMVATAKGGKWHASSVLLVRQRLRPSPSASTMLLIGPV